MSPKLSTLKLQILKWSILLLYLHKDFDFTCIYKTIHSFLYEAKSNKLIISVKYHYFLNHLLI